MQFFLLHAVVIVIPNQSVLKIFILMQYDIGIFKFLIVGLNIFTFF